MSNANEQKFSIGQLVTGRVGCFVVLAYRFLDGEQMVQVKPVCKRTLQLERGEIALPESCLAAVIPEFAPILCVG